MPNDHVNHHELDEAILRILKEGGIGTACLGRGSNGVVEGILKKHPLNVKEHQQKPRVAETLWALINRGLIFINFTLPDNWARTHSDSCPCAEWQIGLTDRGRAAAGDTTINPDKPQGYLEEFVRGITGNVPDVVEMYVKEALKTYSDRSYLACAVMLGVAAEAAFFDLLESFCNWLPPTEGENLRKIRDNRRNKYSKLHDDFRRRLETHKNDLPPGLEADLDLRINAVLGLIRDYRNDSGHPTGKPMDRATCHMALVQFGYAMQRLFALKDFFDVRGRATGT